MLVNLPDGGSGTSCSNAPLKINKGIGIDFDDFRPGMNVWGRRFGSIEPNFRVKPVVVCDLGEMHQRAPIGPAFGNGFDSLNRALAEASFRPPRTFALPAVILLR